MQGEQQQKAQGQQGSHDKLRRDTEVLVVDVLPRGAARRAPALDDRSGALSADQVFTAHRNPFRLARAPALAAMYGLSCQFPSRLFPGLNQVTRKSPKLAAPSPPTAL
jgi:hypothetical protein